MDTRTALTSYLKRRRTPASFAEIKEALAQVGVTNVRSISASLFNGKARSEYIKNEETGEWEINRQFKS